MKKLDNFKNIADSMLQDINITDELKKRTMERCVKASWWRRNFVIPSAAIGIAASFAVIVLISSIGSRGDKLSTGLDKGEQRSSVGVEGAPPVSDFAGRPLNDKANTGSTTSPTTNRPLISGEGSTDYGKLPSGPISGDSNYGSVTLVRPGTDLVPGSIPPQQVVYRQGTLEEAKKYMGDIFRTPTYIPEELKEPVIQVPVDMSILGMNVMLIYEGQNKFISLVQKEGSVPFDSFTGIKEVDINGVKAQLSSRSVSRNEKEVSTYIFMRWSYNGVQYMLEGQLEEEEALKVARSIK